MPQPEGSKVHKISDPKYDHLRKGRSIDTDLPGEVNKFVTTQSKLTDPANPPSPDDMEPTPASFFDVTNSTPAVQNDLDEVKELVDMFINHPLWNTDPSNPEK